MTGQLVCDEEPAIFYRRHALTPFVAISATNLQGLEFLAYGLGKNYFADFLRQQPMAKIGYSIFLYRMH